MQLWLQFGFLDVYTIYCALCILYYLFIYYRIIYYHDSDNDNDKIIRLKQETIYSVSYASIHYVVYTIYNIQCYVLVPHSSGDDFAKSL